MKLIFATNNQHKASEIARIVPSHFSILTLKEAGIDMDIPEPWDTLHDNAKEKAQTIYNLTRQPCFSEDTGLEVVALGGQPGVQSARYAGNEKTDAANIKKLLINLEGVNNRAAQFRTVACLVLDGDEYFFEGVCTGTIATHPSGLAGFGYDPVFIPDGAHKTFAEMSAHEKIKYSHRQKAVTKLVAFLNNFS